ncbi:MAG TPA: glycosyltransferase family 87 protein, partial [Urbifossiella sp.]|nr:glycosyltransferase family 87 protein [Urbifossiella sp.]
MNPRRLFTAAGVVLAAGLLAGQVRALLADPTVWPPDDFVEYWAAARLTLTGGNPYDPAQLLPLQLSAGRDTDEAVMMWNPPWALAAVLPLGLLPAREAQLLWLAANLLAAGFCGDRLWLRFGGDPARRWVGWAAALGFIPTLFALQSGQIGPLLLLGAVLFLEAERRGWPALAGAATVLLAIKPHLAYLVWAAILCDAVARRRAAVLVGGAVTGVLATAVPLLFDPQVVHQYADAMGNRPPDQWVSPTPGTVLRLAFGEERFGLQFVPVVAGCAWFAWYWRKAGRTWDWADQLPLLLLVSFVTAPYGAWPFDLVLLLPAGVRLLAGGAPRPVLAGLLAVNLACLVMNVLRTGSFPFLWVAPALLGLYVVGVR